MQAAETDFEQLCQHVRRTALLKSTLALLEWDQQTGLPAGAASYRSEQISFLAGQIHHRATAASIGDWLDRLRDSDLAADRSSDTGATIAMLDRDYQRQIRMPVELVEALAAEVAKGHSIWVESRKANDFSRFAPQLETILSLKRQQADAIGHQGERYDALLDEYEPGARTEQVAEVLAGLREQLVPMISAIAAADRQPDPSLLHRDYPIELQRALGRDVAAAIGFDFQRGRIDDAAHPFCTELGPFDCRITTRYDPHFFSTAFFGTLHEAGHGIYEQGLRSDQYGLPLGSYCSLGIHESQSRLWENLVGRSEPFWQYFYPQLQSRFSAALGDVDRDSFYAAINHVAPSLIRVEADEATYNLHIAIRFELERELIADRLAVADLPDAWNERYREYLGLEPPSDADGVLQDVHWSAGLFGYFPTYTLGNLYASQLFEAAAAALGDLPAMLQRREFDPLREWLNVHLHQHGRRWSGPELGRQATGEALSHDALIRHLKQKYGPIYGIEFAD